MAVLNGCRRAVGQGTTKIVFGSKECLLIISSYYAIRGIMKILTVTERYYLVLETIHTIHYFMYMSFFCTCQ